MAISFVMIFCTVVCFYLTYHQLHLYFKYPTATKTTVERNRTVQFPSFSICLFSEEGNYNVYRRELANEIKNKCRLKNLEDCDTAFHDLQLQELDLNLQQIWDQYSLNSVTAQIYNVDDTSAGRAIVISRRYSALGSCEVVTHTDFVNYFSARTFLQVEFENSNTLTFIPHGEPAHSEDDYEFMNNEMEFIPPSSTFHLRIQEQNFKLLNLSDSICYDYQSERERLKQRALELFSNHGACRLPFLPDTFPECQSFDDVSKSLQVTDNVTLELWSDVTWSSRRICKYNSYAISVDYVDKTKPSNITVLIIKFVDDTKVIITEEYSYTFPALVSDLFAYWGFFLCLSALVFVEIFEFVINKIYLLCKHFNKHK